ncbi:hypothetical protein AAC387_Pa02g2055 [Persea americana]
MIYRRKARDGLIDGANGQARFEPPAWSNWAILDARTTVFGPVRPMPIVPTPRARTPAAAGGEAQIDAKSKKGVQHEDFPGGHPSKYYSRPSTLNCGVLMGSGALALRRYDRTRGISAEETICAFRNGGSCGQAWRVEALTFDPPARFAIMIYRRKARDGLIDGANGQARFEPPAWSNWAILDARTTVFGPVRPMPIVPTPRARTPAAAGPI